MNRVDDSPAGFAPLIPVKSAYAAAAHHEPVPIGTRPIGSVANSRPGDRSRKAKEIGDASTEFRFCRGSEPLPNTMTRRRGALTLVKSPPRESTEPGRARTKIASHGALVDTPAVPSSTADPSFVRDSYASTAFADVVDRSLHAAMARFTAGLSPIALAGAYTDCASHLAFSPGKRSQLVEKAAKKALRFASYAGKRALQPNVEPCIVPLPQDRRFDDPAWREPPFDMLYQGFLLTQQWWHNAVTGVRGVTRQHEDMVTFGTRQILDVFSPSNSPFTNPEVIRKTREESGMNFVRGAQNFIEDWERTISGKPPVGGEAFLRWSGQGGSRSIRAPQSPRQR